MSHVFVVFLAMQLARRIRLINGKIFRFIFGVLSQGIIDPAVYLTSGGNTAVYHVRYMLGGIPLLPSSVIDAKGGREDVKDVGLRHVGLRMKEGDWWLSEWQDRETQKTR